MYGTMFRGIPRRRLPSLLVSGAASGVRPTLAAELAAEARVVIHDGDEELEKVVHALENSINLSNYYSERKQSVTIQVVFNGLAVANFAVGNSQVGEKVAQFSRRFPRVGLNLCGNSIKAMEKRAGTPFVADKGFVIIPSGAAMLVELQMKRWAYIRV